MAYELPSQTDSKRYATLASVSIDLRSSDPFARLKELCSQGRYRYSFTWDRFLNGVMIQCEVYYFAQRQRFLLTREARFVPTTDISQAKKVISAILLENLGLGMSEEEPPISETQNTQEETEEFADPPEIERVEKILTRAFNVVRDKVSADAGEANISPMNMMEKAMECMEPFMEALSQPPTE